MFKQRLNTHTTKFQKRFKHNHIEARREKYKFPPLLNCDFDFRNLKLIHHNIIGNRIDYFLQACCKKIRGAKSGNIRFNIVTIQIF